MLPATPVLEKFQQTVHGVQLVHHLVHVSVVLDGGLLVVVNVALQTPTGLLALVVSAIVEQLGMQTYIPVSIPLQRPQPPQRHSHQLLARHSVTRILVVPIPMSAAQRTAGAGEDRCTVDQDAHLHTHLLLPLVLHSVTPKLLVHTKVSAAHKATGGTGPGYCDGGCQSGPCSPCLADSPDGDDLSSFLIAAGANWADIATELLLGEAIPGIGLIWDVVGIFSDIGTCAGSAFTFMNVQNNLCLNIAGNNPDNTEMLYYDCSGTQANHVWQFFKGDPIPNPYFQIRSCYSVFPLGPYCLTGANSQLKNVQDGACGDDISGSERLDHGGNPNILLPSDVRFDPSSDTMFALLGAGDSKFLVYNKGNGKCITATGANGVTFAPCNFQDSSQLI